MYCDLPIFGRCCFCLPLRKGILVFGYLNFLFAAFMVGVSSYAIHHGYGVTAMYHGVSSDIDTEFVLAVYCADIVFTVVLLYGAHRQIILYLRVFYYYTLCTLAAAILLEIIELIQTSHYYFQFEMLPLFFAGICLHIYLIFLVRSLLKKMEMSGHTYENQLHQIVNGEVVKDANSVYPTTVIPVETA